MVAASLGALGVDGDAEGERIERGHDGLMSTTEGAEPTRSSASSTTAKGTIRTPGVSDRKPEPEAARPAGPPLSEAVAFPPGTSPAGIESAGKLLRAHTKALSRTGFVVKSTANATVIETGMRIDATTGGGARVAPETAAYYAHRTDAAGPLRRRTEGWYDGSIEHHREIGEFGSVDESTRKARSSGELTGRPLLAPHLRGGAFDTVAAKRVDGKRVLVVTATGIADERFLRKGLPGGTTAIRSYEARLLVDSIGRIRSLTVRVGYAIGGEPAVHHLRYDLVQVGTVTVERPAWVEAPTTGETSRHNESGR